MGGGRRRQEKALPDVVADSIEKSVVALRQLAARSMVGSAGSNRNGVKSMM